MVRQLAKAADRFPMHHGCRSFLRSLALCITLNRQITGFTLWLIAITLLLSRPTVACQQITPGTRSSSGYTGIEIIPRGGAWKAPVRARNATAANPVSSQPSTSVQSETVRPLQANRPQFNSPPYEDPKPFHRNLEFADTSVSPPTEIRIKSPNFAQRNAEGEALQTPTEYPAEPAVTENRNVSPTVAENAVPLIHIIEPPTYVRLETETETETETASTSANSQPIELWKPLRRFERAERLIDQKPTLPPSYAATETRVAETHVAKEYLAEKQTNMIESFDALDIETIEPPLVASESSQEPRVVAPEPRKSHVRKSAVAANGTNYPRAGHSLLAAPSRPPLASRDPITFPQDPPLVAKNPQNSAPRQKPLTIPKQAQPTTQPPPAAIASGRYGRHPSTAQTTAGPLEGPLSASRYGATLATNTNHSIPSTAAKANTRYAPASSQHQSVPARQAGHSMLQSGTSYRQTR
ncbi:MAG: hypothetical protein WCK86_10920 [Planctomycetia bacterium]